MIILSSPPQQFISARGYLINMCKWANVLTKDIKLPGSLESALMSDTLDMPGVNILEVKIIDGEINMLKKYSDSINILPV